MYVRVKCKKIQGKRKDRGWFGRSDEEESSTELRFRKVSKFLDESINGTSRRVQANFFNYSVLKGGDLCKLELTIFFA